MTSEKGYYPGHGGPSAPPTYEASQDYPAQAGYANPYPPQQQGYAPVYSDHPHFQPQPPQGQTQVLVAPGPVLMTEPPPPDYMSRAIFVTLCCFWPVGIFAIMKASEAKNAYARGDFAAARSNASSARQLSNIGIIAGVASLVVGMIIVGIYVGLIMGNMRGY